MGTTEISEFLNSSAQDDSQGMSHKRDRKTAFGESPSIPEKKSKVSILDLVLSNSGSLLPIQTHTAPIQLRLNHPTCPRVNSVIYPSRNRRRFLRPDESPACTPKSVSVKIQPISLSIRILETLTTFLTMVQAQIIASITAATITVTTICLPIPRLQQLLPILGSLIRAIIPTMEKISSILRKIKPNPQKSTVRLNFFIAQLTYFRAILGNYWKPEDLTRTQFSRYHSIIQDRCFWYGKFYWR